MSSGDMHVSARGRFTLPAAIRRRWGLESGGEVGFIDLDDCLLLVPGGVTRLRHELLDRLTDQDWRMARVGFGDTELASQ